MTRRPRRDEPVPLRDAVAAVGRDLGMPDPDELQRVVAAWPEVAGAALAAHAAVRSVREGVCTIAAEGPAWATQVRYLADDLVRRAEVVCGPGVVTSVRVVVATLGSPGS